METAVEIKDKVVEVGSNVAHTVTEKVAEGYTVAKDTVVGAAEVVSENVGYATEKIKHGAETAIETASEAAVSVKKTA